MGRLAERLALFIFFICTAATFVICFRSFSDDKKIARVYRQSSEMLDGTLMGRLPQTCNATCAEDSDEKPYDCFQGMCSCTNTSAVCSNNGQQLLFIPRLPASICFLNFSGNELGVIPEHFFDNVTQLTSLSLVNNSISEIHPQAFQRLQSLKFLYLARNLNLTGQALKAVFTVRSLECLDLRYNNLKSLPEDVLRENPIPNLTELFLHHNDLEEINLTDLQHIQNLSVLSWGSNNVYKFSAAMMSKLKMLDLFGNRLIYFPDTCSTPNGSVPFFPKLKILMLNVNKLNNLPSTICLPSLEHLDLGGNFFPYLKSDMFGPKLFPKLKKITLAALATHVKLIEPYAFRHPELRMISLMYDEINFSLVKQYSDDSFSGCPNLQTLQLSHNFFTKVSDQRFQRLIGNVTSLQELYLGGVGLWRIPMRTFSSLLELKILKLYQNKIAKIPDGAFDQNPNLHVLDLNNNQIGRIWESTFGQDLRKNFTYLDLSGNPFVCDCNLRWFISWFKGNRSIFAHKLKIYSCSNYENVLIETFKLNAQECLLSPDQSFVIICVMTFGVVIILVLGCLWRLQWRIRLKLYEVFRGRRDFRRYVLLTDNFKYDVFVSYAGEDGQWVQNNVVTSLEQGEGLRLCVHERDFRPGRQILDNVVNNLELSKKVLLVFSRNFLHSAWCQFELGVCLEHALGCDDGPIVVCVDDVAFCDLTSAMRAVMTTFTYLQWDGRTAAARDMFRQRLEESVEDLAPRKMSSNATRVMTMD